jgi:hypothetical protein
MDQLKIPEKNKEYTCRFAAPSILTGRFVAHILCKDGQELREVLTEPGKLYVYNVHVGTKEYVGYRFIHSMEEQTDGFIVKLTKDADDADQQEGNGNGTD